jgi:hypothetical protein
MNSRVKNFFLFFFESMAWTFINWTYQPALTPKGSHIPARRNAPGSAGKKMIIALQRALHMERRLYTRLAQFIAIVKEGINQEPSCVVKVGVNQEPS